MHPTNTEHQSFSDGRKHLHKMAMYSQPYLVEDPLHKTELIEIRRHRLTDDVVILYRKTDFILVMSIDV